MKYLIILLSILGLSFLESTVLPLNLIILPVICLAVRQRTDEALIMAFLAGMILDLSTGRILGLDSFFFLSLTLLIHLYQRRFQADRLRFLLPFTFLAVIINSTLLGGALTPVKLVINTALIIPARLFLQPFFKEEKQEQLEFA